MFIQVSAWAGYVRMEEGGGGTLAMQIPGFKESPMSRRQ